MNRLSNYIFSSYSSNIGNAINLEHLLELGFNCPDALNHRRRREDYGLPFEKKWW